MTKWEYKVVRTGKENSFSIGKSIVEETEGELNGQTIDSAFNKLGEHGWELVTAFNHSLSTMPWYMFKRPLG
jgi:hypothetical protein